MRGAGRHIREVKLSLPASPASTCQPSTQSPSPNVTSRLTVLTSPLLPSRKQSRPARPPTRRSPTRALTTASVRQAHPRLASPIPP